MSFFRYMGLSYSCPHFSSGDFESHIRNRPAMTITRTAITSTTDFGNSSICRRNISRKTSKSIRNIASGTAITGPPYSLLLYLMVAPNVKPRKPSKQYDRSYDACRTWVSEVEKTVNYYARRHHQSPVTHLWLHLSFGPRGVFDGMSATRALFDLFYQSLGAFWTYFKSHCLWPRSAAIQVEVTKEIAKPMPWREIKGECCPVQGVGSKITVTCPFVTARSRL